MVKRLIVLSLVGIFSFVSSGSAGINCGQGGGFVIKSNATLNLTGATLNDATIKVCQNGTLSGSLSGLNTTIVSLDPAAANAITFDGSYSATDNSLTLTDNQSLSLEGGSSLVDVAITSGLLAPSRVSGDAALIASMSLAVSKKTYLALDGELKVSVLMGADSLVVLESDLSFGNGYCFEVSGGAGTRTVDFNGNTITAGDVTVVGAQSWINPSLSLRNDIGFSGEMTITGDVFINGNGNSFTPESNFVSTGSVSLVAQEVTLNNLANFRSAASWQLIDTVLAAGTTKVSCSGSIVSNSVEVSPLDIYNKTIYFNAATLSLHSDVLLNEGALWQIGSGWLTVLGNGCSLDCASSGTRISYESSGSYVYFQNISLLNCVEETFDLDICARTIGFSNVYYSCASIAPNEKEYGALHIQGVSGVPVSYTVDGSENDPYAAGNLFAQDGTWNVGVHLTLESDITLSNKWTFAQDSIIDGGGYKIIFDGGVLNPSDGVTLTLRNVIIEGLVDTSFGSSTGSINIASATVRLGASIDWSESNTGFVIDGPVTFVTSNFLLSVNSEYAVINNTTVYYDTLNNVDGFNVYGFGGTGRVFFVGRTASPSLVIPGDADLEENVYLYVPSEDDVAGRTMLFSGASSMVYNGRDRSIFFPKTNDVVVTVDDDTAVVTTNIVLDGLQSNHIGFGENSDFYFGDKTIVRLGDDCALTTTLNFGDPGAGVNQSMVLDLNGKSIDFADASAAIRVQPATDCTAELRIMNGRLINVHGTMNRLRANNSVTIIFQDVECLISADWALGNTDDTAKGCAITFEGNCVLGGVSGKMINFYSESDVSIAAHTTVTIKDGIGWYHATNTRANNFVFTDGSSHLMLLGSSFNRCDALCTDKLLFTNGLLIVDHNATLDAGLRGIQIGNGNVENDFGIQLLPGATLSVQGSGGLKYYNNCLA